MRTTLTRFVSGLATFAGSAALFCGMGSSASAQYHAVYGGGAEDAARGGIIETSTGEFISVGYSDSFGNDRDVYVVKTDKCGRLLWARTYDFAGIDEGKKIRETKDGGFIIVGNTENLRNCCTRNDAFLLKIKSDGNFEWARTLGGIDDDQGADVKVRDDVYYFAGRTNSFGHGDYDAWLGAVDNGGNLLWSRVYGGDFADGFNALDFSDCDGGTIVAAGDTRSYTGDQNLDIFAIKTDFGGVPIPRWPLHYGSDVDDGAWSILGHKEEIYIAGYTDGVGNGREGYISHLDCDGNRRADIAYGGAGVGLDDQFTEIQYNQFNDNLALTGFMQNPPGGLGEYDVWLMEVDQNLAALNPIRVYGGKKDDQGWSLVVTNGLNGKWDYVIAGWTESYQVFGGRDLYQIRADQNGKSGCNESEPKLQKKEPGYEAQEAPSWWPQVRVICNAEVEVRENEEWKYICTSCPGFLNIPGDQDLSLRNNHDAEPARVVMVSQATK